jgi:hypothetical protein
MNDSEKKSAIREKLESTRADLLHVARELTEEEWTQPVYAHDGEWTALDLLRHLTWAESGMLRLLRQLQQGEEGVPPDFDLDRYNASGVQRLAGKVPAELMAMMAQNREELLAFLDTLQAEDWEKEGRHGSLRIMTIEAILNLIADHESQHLADLREVLEREP